MTGYTVHTGSNDKFRDGWENIFSGKKKSSKKTASKATKKSKSPVSKKTKKPTKKAGNKKS